MKLLQGQASVYGGPDVAMPAPVVLPSWDPNVSVSFSPAGRIAIQTDPVTGAITRYNMDTGEREDVGGGTFAPSGPASPTHRVSRIEGAIAKLRK